MEKRFETFTTQIAKIGRYIRKIKTMEMSQFNLNSTHVSCVYYLYKHDKALTAKELCDLCDEDKAAISRSIDYLEKNGFLICDAKTEKRYKSPLSLTEKGNEVGKIVSKKVDKILSSVGLSENDREEFYRCLILIGDNLQKICENLEKNGEKND